MQHYSTNYHRGQRKMILVVKFFCIFEFACFVVSTCIFYFSAIFHLPLLEAASSIFFSETGVMPVNLHLAVFQASPRFQKRFPCIAFISCTRSYMYDVYSNNKAKNNSKKCKKD